jgi:hypothetical protein
MSRESSKDQDLQSVRRIDWRYLLPDSRLRNVAYLGLRDEPLIYALKLFSDSFSLYGQESQELEPNKRNTYDLVVVNSPQFMEVRQAASLMKPGTNLYWEVNRLRAMKYVRDEIMSRKYNARVKIESLYTTIANLVRLNPYVDFAKTLGLRDVSIFWHRPDFDRCLEIVPLDNRRALDYYFSRWHGTALKSIKYSAGKILLESGLLKNIVPCVSLVAMR